nr:hypothetical protein [uncultured Flavobacterium sp.]
MSTVLYNHLKNEVDNRIKEYDKHFEMNLITKSENPCNFKYASTYQAVDFSIEIKYLENQIKFSSFIGISYSSATTFEIASFLKFVEDMPQEDFKRRIEFSFSK